METCTDILKRHCLPAHRIFTKKARCLAKSRPQLRINDCEDIDQEPERNSPDQFGYGNDAAAHQRSLDIHERVSNQAPLGRDSES